MRRKWRWSTWRSRTVAEEFKVSGIQSTSSIRLTDSSVNKNWTEAQHHNAKFQTDFPILVLGLFKAFPISSFCIFFGLRSYFLIF